MHSTEPTTSGGHMTRSDSVAPPGPEFNDFLFSSIGEDRNGMLLSVLSALVRSNVDPWQEAAELAQLPGKAATQRLALLIADLPDELSELPDPKTIAARLIALLPRTRSNAVSRKKLFGIAVVPNSWVVVYGVFIFMAFVLATQFITTSAQAPTRIEKIHASASSTVPPERRSSNDSP
jgi:hypothetical protein